MGPSSRPDEEIVLSAHLDSQNGMIGACDNLTGVATLLEIARALAPFQSQFRRTLRVVAFTGEELMFMGSRSYVEQHRHQLDRVRFVFNMDGLFPSTAEGVAVMLSPPMQRWIDGAMRTTQRDVAVRGLFCVSSDYLPFMMEGIPAARPADYHDMFPPYSHTKADTPAVVPADWIRLNAMTFAQLIARLVTEDGPLPAHRLTKEQVAAACDQAGTTEILRSLKFSVS